MIRALPLLAARVLRLRAHSQAPIPVPPACEDCPGPPACDLEECTPCSCGWHLSSYELRQGVEVVECELVETPSLAS